MIQLLAYFYGGSEHYNVSIDDVTGAAGIEELFVLETVMALRRRACSFETKRELLLTAPFGYCSRPLLQLANNSSAGVGRPCCSCQSSVVVPGVGLRFGVAAFVAVSVSKLLAANCGFIGKSDDAPAFPTGLSRLAERL